MSTESVPSQGYEGWAKSSYSNDGDACADIALEAARAAVPGATVGARDTKLEGRGPVLSFLPAAWSSFVDELVKPGSPLAGGF